MSEGLKQLIAKAAEALRATGAKEVYLFGSAAGNRIGEESDVDLAVAGLPPERFLEAMGKAGRILRRQVDLVDLDEGNPFTEYLKAKGEMLRVA
jgi:predicted nucleotidyltransferase